MVLVLEMIGLTCFIAAAWLVSPALGVFVIGMASMATALAMSRNVGKDDKK
jgi:hypothetical protein